MNHLNSILVKLGYTIFFISVSVAVICAEGGKENYEQKYEFDKATTLTVKPVESVVFALVKVKIIGNGVSLVTWGIKNKEDSVGYYLECSRDSLRWEKLYHSYGQEDASHVKDTDVQPGKNYYRVVSVLNDGEIEVLGGEVYYAINSEGDVSYVEAFVNKEEQTLRINSSKLITYIELLDAKEQVLLKSDVPELNKVKTNLSNYNQGEYYLHIYMGEYWERKKILVQ